MSEEVQARALERAIVGQAEALAAARLERAAAEQTRILEGGDRRRREAEERLLARTRVDAERLCKRRVQAAEIARQGELDRLRATLVDQLMAAVRTRLTQLVHDAPAYTPRLEALLAAAAGALPGNELRVRVNARDRQLLAADWPQTAQRIAPGRRLVLDETCCEAIGGGLVFTAAGERRLDNTFDGRLARLGSVLAALALEQLSACE
ncbi:MAG: V-type ATP synthase subunit E family protein [Rhodocyclaceae bacterium]|nr:V-type ATP synthase subunit E family protein [Rhodocyclaceae bacterium]